MTEPRLRVGLVGAGRATGEEEELARRVGVALAEAGAVLICGGLGGVMLAGARGCSEAGGLTVGFLPAGEPTAANRWIGLPLATGMGEARNVLIVRASEALVSVGGGWGTLSEIALAGKLGRPVITLGTPPADGLGLPTAATPEEAVAWALARAREGRDG